MTFVVNLTDYTPPQRYPPAGAWTQAAISYSLDNVQAYSLLTTINLSPLDPDPVNPQARSFTITNVPTSAGWLQLVWLDGSGGQASTNPVQYPVQTGQGAANPTLLSARYGVRHRIRDGVPLLDGNPVAFNTVRLEDLSDQIPQIPTPIQTVFQCRYADIPTQRYMNAHVVPGTLVAYVNGSWVPTQVTKDVDQNGNFTLPIPPVSRLLITYAWQYLSDGEIDQFVDEARQWLREFSTVTAIPDGLVPALISYAASRTLDALSSTASMLAPVKAGDSDIDWSKLAESYQKAAQIQYARAGAERQGFYDQGPEKLDPTVVDVAFPSLSSYTPKR